MKNFWAILLCTLITTSLTAQSYDISSAQIEVGFKIRDSIDNIGNQYIRYAAPLRLATPHK